MDIFCKIISGDIPSKCLYQDDIVMVVMDVNPSTNGHSLIIPRKHYKDIYDIDNDTLLHIFDVARDISNKITKRLGCDGVSFCQNNGIAQEVKHFHLHIIPKYKDNVKLENVDDIYDKIME